MPKTKRKPKARHTVYCATCGRGFEAANPNANTCSTTCRTNAFSQRERDKLDNLVDSVTITTTPTPDGQTSVYVEAPTEVWTVLEGIAEREGTTAYEVMGDIAKQSLLRAMRKEKRNA